MKEMINKTAGAVERERERERERVSFARREKNEGITLVALIITIIVLIILTAVTIITFTKTGLLKTASEGTQNYANAQSYEKQIMNNIDNHIKDVIRDIVDIEAGIVGENPEDLDSKVVYEPNGNEEYKREHKIQIVVNEKVDKVKSIKYQWLNTQEEPKAETFLETCNNNETIIGEGFTGTYYLWTLLETQSGKNEISRSEAFYFNNEGPKITGINSIPVSDTSFTINVTVNEGYSKPKECKIYVNEEYKETKDIDTNTVSYTVTGAKTGDNNCYVIVTDILGNETKQTVIGKTKLYVWEKWNTEKTILYKKEVGTLYKKIEHRYDCKYYVNLQESDWNKNLGCYNTSRPSSHSGWDAWNVGLCDNYGNWFSQFIYFKSKGELNEVPDGCYFASIVGSFARDGYIWYDIELYNINAVEESISYSKGTIKATDVTNANRNAYPNRKEKQDENGEYYWYIFKGVEQ